MRSISFRFKVEPGNYLIVPCTYEKDVRLGFLLRVYTESEIESDSILDCDLAHSNHIPNGTNYGWKCDFNNEEEE
jgi:hypothetical protein